jgi:hypothetical protein
MLEQKQTKETKNSQLRKCNLTCKRHRFCGPRDVRSGRAVAGNGEGLEKGSGTFCAKHPSGRSGKRFLTPFSIRPEG